MKFIITHTKLVYDDLSRKKLKKFSNLMTGTY